jgi:hypothetical protein
MSHPRSNLGMSTIVFRVTTFPKERVPVPSQALGAGVQRMPLAVGWARRSGTLAYGGPAIPVARLL